ncbi:Clp1/GlmU family protein [Desulfopila sp. IMCC35008]|uniref:Clp1/GlmU family protein n=1 Tax=Desulfopila sp. IMCC35008 TaxID=2653858 RepID=UPI0013D28BB4|nr:Clp1/GlmU family protein [Desulfopila sp. IMCC35008]
MHAVDIPTIGQNFLSTLTVRLQPYRRILLWGEPGTGKSTLAVELLRHMSLQAHPCMLLELDPGTPPFGVPGAVSIAHMNTGELLCQYMLPLCTLNSARFRLPLIVAARNLLLTAQSHNDGSTLLIDPPGIVKGVGGAELLLSLVETLAIEALLILCKTSDLPLENELSALSVPLFRVSASAAAKRPTKTARAKSRTKLWDQFLASARREECDLQAMHPIGTPPPNDTPDAWLGKQVALLDSAGNLVAMGEIVGCTANQLTARIVRNSPAQATTLLIRDAGRNEAGHLITVPPPSPRTHTTRRVPGDMGIAYRPADARSQPLSIHMGAAWATLVGGVFEDPLLHVRLRNQKRSFLFDLGAPARLPAKIAHQVEAVFLSHAHLDHIAGFIWFLRSRLGPFGPCTIFGPDGSIERFEHFLNAITWDRIDDRGPMFIVAEIRENELIQAQLQPGRKRVSLPSRTIKDGIIIADDDINIRAAICDHNIPSIAYALEFVRGISIRKDKLRKLNLNSGPWLGQLKKCISSQSTDVYIDLPDGSKQTAGELAKLLAIITPGKKLAYVADMADTQENRRKVVKLAHGAHTLFCEAAFAKADQGKAEATQHLTTIAAARIAKSAGVKQLVPFHFSKRYEFKPHLLYEEICSEAGNVCIICAT